MRHGCWLLAGCMLGSALSLAAQEAQPAGSKSAAQARIQKLIGQLGSKVFAERQQAARELEAIGEPALPALRVVTSTGQANQRFELEVVRRAADIQRRLETKIATARLLAPKRVHLKLKNVSVLAAIHELENQSKYPIMISGDRKQLVARKITLDTGATTFWEAFDQLCQKAGLVDGDPYLPAVAPPPMQIRPPVRIPPQFLPVNPPQPPRPAKAVNRVFIEGRVAIVQVVDVKAEAPRPAVQPARAQPAPPPPQPGRNPYHYMIPRPPSSHLQVRAGKPAKVPTSYSGAVRIRAYPHRSAQQPEVLSILLDVFAEPRLQNFALNGAPHVKKAVDDQGQALGLHEKPANGTGQATHLIYAQGNRQAVLRFRLGRNKAKLLRELTGRLTAQALTPTETLVAATNILKSAGKTFKGAGGATLHIVAASKSDGKITIQARMENFAAQNAIGGVNAMVIQQIQIQARGNIVIGGMPYKEVMPTLVDRDGKSFPLVQIPRRSLRIANGIMSQELTMEFRPNPGQGEPDRLQVTGQRTVTFQIPFSFRDIKIGQAQAVLAPLP